MLSTISWETSSSHSRRCCTMSEIATRDLLMTLPRSYSPDDSLFHLTSSCNLPWLPIVFVWNQSQVSTSHRYWRHAYLGCRSGAFSVHTEISRLYFTQICQWKARVWSSCSSADTSASWCVAPCSLRPSSFSYSWSDLQSLQLTK